MYKYAPREPGPDLLQCLPQRFDSSLEQQTLIVKPNTRNKQTTKPHMTRYLVENRCAPGKCGPSKLAHLHSKGGMIWLETLIELNCLSNRSCRAYPLIEIKQTVPCRAIRGDGISVNSTLPPSYTWSKQTSLPPPMMMWILYRLVCCPYCNGNALRLRRASFTIWSNRKTPKP